MALGGCYSCIKYLMFAFNFLFWIIGCALLGLGIWIRVDSMFEKYENFNTLYPFAYVMIALGVVIMVVGFLGCCGAIRESPIMLGLFFLFLFLVFVAMFGFGIYCIVERETTKERVSQLFLDWVQTYETNKNSKMIMDNIQHDFQCCGATSRLDYRADFEPKSCPKKDYEEGCSAKFIEWISTKIIIFAVVAISIAVVLILGMIFSLVLCCAVREANV